MKEFISTLLILTLFSCNQNNKTQDKNINYFPKQNTNVSDENYRINIERLQMIYTNMEAKDSMDCGDHWNLFMIYLNLKEPFDIVSNELKKAEEKDIDFVANMFKIKSNDISKNGDYLTAKQNQYFKTLNEKYNSYLIMKEEPEFDLEEYCKEKNLDIKLVQQMILIEQLDQKYRNEESRPKDSSKETPEQIAIDKTNQKSIDSLYNVAGQYIGNSLVGEKHSLIMLFVIIHSEDLHYYEKYLTVLEEAMTKKEISKGVFKLFVDFYYEKKYGFQIFGTIPKKNLLAPEDTIESVKIRFNLE